MKFEQQLNNFSQAKKEERTFGPDNETYRAIEARADLRRRGQKFRIEASNLEQSGSVNNEIKAAHDKTLKFVFSEAVGKPHLPPGSAEDFKKEARELARKAEIKEALFPNLSAYYYAQAAKFNEAAGEDFHEKVSAAKRCAAASDDIPKTSPESLLPDAILLGIQVREIAKSKIPSKKEVAKIAAEDHNILYDYALVLPEDERAEFLELLPEEKRKRAEIIFDKALSEVLNEKIIAGEDERKQRINVQSRSQGKLKNYLEFPDKSAKLTLKIITQTVKELAGEDSARLLKELGEKGLKRASGREDNAARISHTARILRELFLLDQNKGSASAMKFLGKSDLPHRIFDYFMLLMTKNGFITENASKYLNKKEDAAVLKKLIAQYPNQLNTVIDTLAKISGYNLAGNEEEIFGAINDLESITPLIFNRYRQADASGKKELAKQLRELKPKFFQNTPIGGILPKKDNEILAEMVYLAYKPVGMSFESVKKLLNQLEDKTGDLEKYKFPPEGYGFALESKKSFALKQGAEIDYQRLLQHKSLFAAEYPANENDVKNTSLLFERLAKAGTDFKKEELQKLFSIISADELVRNFNSKYGRLDEKNSYHYLNELKEIIGVYFKDNYSVRLASFISANPTLNSRLHKILSDANRQEIFEKKLQGKSQDKIDWKKTLESDNLLAETISNFIFSKVIKNIREDTAINLNKFEEKESGAEVVSDRANLKAYISKNIGSFFAKASAGICTAEDIGLFEREDHFHINIVENDDFIRANIQAYIINDNGGKSLVLRGFNPNTDFLDKINPGAFCEKVIKIAKEFATGNNLRRVYITEDLGGWHALSNRDNVNQYLIKKYLKGKAKKYFRLQIASGQSVDSIYEV